jgi:hypothetical protein
VKLRWVADGPDEEQAPLLVAVEGAEPQHWDGCFCMSPGNCTYASRAAALSERIQSKLAISRFLVPKLSCPYYYSTCRGTLLMYNKREHAVVSLDAFR